MNCADWEREIAGESSAAGIAEHLQGCERCREFAAEMEANRVALRGLTVHPAAFEAVRRRVLDEIQAEKRPVFWWRWAVVAAAAVVVLCVVYFVERPGVVGPRIAEVPNKAPVISQAPPPARELVRHRRVRRRLSVAMSGDAARKSACATGMSTSWGNSNSTSGGHSNGTSYTSWSGSGIGVSGSMCEQLTVKMLTSDPDVIIIWLVDQKGDSL
jgi:hypothetical protein